MIFDDLNEMCDGTAPVEPIFIGAKPGTGKSYLLNTMISQLRSRSKIVISCASTACAALLLKYGRTAHSYFKIPLDVHKDSTCNVKRGSKLAELLASASTIIIDEVTMLNRYVIEAIDKTLKV